MSRLSLPLAPGAASHTDPRQPVVVTLPDGETLAVKQLLDVDAHNPKLAKSLARGYRTAGLSLLPARLSGVNVCPGSSPGCRAACLNTAGHGGVFPAIHRRRLAKTLAWRKHRGWFAARLDLELSRFVRRCREEGYRPAVRLNVLSDLPWEDLVPTVFRHDARYYDYSAVRTRMERFLRQEFPANYSLCWSRKEDNEDACKRFLARGGTVSVVFAGPKPARFWEHPVVDGDADDLRFLDPPGVVVGLSAKGKARRDRTGFVVRDAAWPRTGRRHRPGDGKPVRRPTARVGSRVEEVYEERLHKNDGRPLL